MRARIRISYLLLSVNIFDLVGLAPVVWWLVVDANTLWKFMLIRDMVLVFMLIYYSKIYLNNTVQCIHKRFRLGCAPVYED